MESIPRGPYWRVEIISLFPWRNRDDTAVDRVGPIFFTRIVNHKPIIASEVRHPGIAEIFNIGRSSQDTVLLPLQRISLGLPQVDPIFANSFGLQRVEPIGLCRIGNDERARMDRIFAPLDDTRSKLPTRASVIADELMVGVGRVFAN